MKSQQNFILSYCVYNMSFFSCGSYWGLFLGFSGVWVESTSNSRVMFLSLGIIHILDQIIFYCWGYFVGKKKKKGWFKTSLAQKRPVSFSLLWQSKMPPSLPNVHCLASLHHSPSLPLRTSALGYGPYYKCVVVFLLSQLDAWKVLY